MNIDKLVLSCWTSTLGKPAFEAAFTTQLSRLGFHCRPIPDKQFDDCKTWSLGRIHIALACKPRYSSQSRYRVQLNPSYFASFDDLTRFFSLAIPGFDANRTKITVLDVSLDFHEPLPTLRQRLHIKGYHRLDLKLSRESTLSLYVGSNPLYRLYDKGLEQHIGKGWLTRLEIHTVKEHIPIQTFAELPKLPDANLFKNVQLVDIAALNGKTQILKDFWSLYQRLGYEPACFMFRSQRNFYRDIGRHLRVLKTESLSSFAQNGLNAFFNPPVSSQGSVA